MSAPSESGAGVAGNVIPGAHAQRRADDRTYAGRMPERGNFTGNFARMAASTSSGMCDG